MTNESEAVEVKLDRLEEVGKGYFRGSRNKGRVFITCNVPGIKLVPRKSIFDESGVGHRYLDIVSAGSDSDLPAGRQSNSDEAPIGSFNAD